MEKETGDAISCLRTDRGGEFTSLKFNEYCKLNGISSNYNLHPITKQGCKKEELDDHEHGAMYVDKKTCP